MVKFLISIISILNFTLAIGLSQSQNVVYQTLANAQNLTSQPFHSVNVNAIGQASHLVKITLTDNGSPGVCATNISTSFIAALEGSNDNFVTSIFPIVIIQGVGFQTNYGIYGFGTYPYIRVTIFSLDNTHCLASIFYSGSLYPTSGFVPNSYYGFLNGELNIVSGTTTTSNAITPNLTSSTVNYPVRNNLHYLFVSNESAGTETVGLTISTSQTGCAGINPAEYTTVIPTGGNFQLPFISQPYILAANSGIAGGNGAYTLCFNTSTNASGHSLNVQYITRFDQ